MLDQRTVLHNITDNSEFIKVSPSSLRSKGLLECNLGKGQRTALVFQNPGRKQYLNIVNVVAVPGCAEEFVSES